MATTTLEADVSRQFESLLLEKPYKHIYCVITPAAASVGRYDSFMVITMADHVVLGVESIQVTKVSDYEELLVDHIRQILSMPYARGAQLVLDVIAGVGLEAAHIQNLVTRHFPMTIEKNDFVHKRGTLVTRRDQQIWLLKYPDAAERLKVHRFFVSSDPSAVCRLESELREIRFDNIGKFAATYLRACCLNDTFKHPHSTL